MDPTPQPPAFEIPAATVQQWKALDRNKPLTLPITAAEIENLFLAIDSNGRATFALQRALVEWTNGRQEAANAANDEATAHLLASANGLRFFLNAIMTSAVVTTEQPNG